MAKKTNMKMMVMMMMIIMMMMMHRRPISFNLSRHSSSETVAVVKQHVNALQMPSKT